MTHSWQRKMDAGHNLQASLRTLVQNLKSFYWYCCAFVLTGEPPRATAGRSAANRRSRPLPRLDQTIFTIRSSGGYQIISFQDSPSVRRAKENRFVRQQLEAQETPGSRPACTWTVRNRDTDRVKANSQNTTLSGPPSSYGNKDRAHSLEPTELNKKLHHDNKDSESRKSGRNYQTIKKNPVKQCSIGCKVLINKDTADNEYYTGNKESTNNEDRRFSHREGTMGKPQGNRTSKHENFDTTPSASDYKDLKSEYRNIYHDAKNKEQNYSRWRSGTNDSTSQVHKRNQDSKYNERTSFIAENYKNKDRIRHTDRESSYSKADKERDKDSNKDKEKARETSRRSSSTWRAPRRQVVQNDWMTVQTTAENSLKI